MKNRWRPLAPAPTLVAAVALGQLIDKTSLPNTAGEGINKSLPEQVGTGRGDRATPDSSSYVIARDPFRAIRRGRQLFQRKFGQRDGLGPVVDGGIGDVATNAALGAGLADSCASCHGRPRGSAGFGGAVATRPDSRDAPHLFGMGLKEMLADEITAELRAIRDQASREAMVSSHDVTRPLVGKSIAFGTITAHADGRLDTSAVEGVDADLRVRPFFAHGGTISIRESVVGALQNEMGLQAVDSELATALAGGRVVTPAGMTLDGSRDRVEAPPTGDPRTDPDRDGVANEIPQSLVDYYEFYLLNYFKPGSYAKTQETRRGAKLMAQVGCTDCHVRNLQVDRDRRVADVQTDYDEERGVFNNLFATARTLIRSVTDRVGAPPLQVPLGESFLVRDLFTDFKRHDLGPAFHERQYDGTVRTQFMTAALWGVGSTGPYGHDGRSLNLTEVILRHGGEARQQRQAFAALNRVDRAALLEFLSSLVLFPPDDTASNLDPGDPEARGYPQLKHGSIKLGVLFNDPNDWE